MCSGVLSQMAVYVPTLTNGHDIQAVAERTRLWIQVAEVRGAGLSLKERGRSLEPAEEV